MLLDDFRTRLAGQVTELPAERLQFAADLAELIRQNALPNAPLSGFVIDAGTRPTDQGQSGAGFFIQGVEQRVATVLVFNSANDVSGGNAVERADAIVAKVLKAPLGWAPDGDDEHVYTTDFRLSGSEVSSLVNGRVIYQLEHVIGLQLRILS
jgi:hypothetical protein